MTWSSGSLGGQEGLNPPRPPSIPLLGPVSSAQSTTAGPIWSVADSRAEVFSDSAPACIGLHQEGRGPARIFGRRFVPRVWAGPGNPEAPAWLCAQGSHYSLQGPGGEPASAALGGGRPSLSFACPVRALTCYFDRTQSFRTSDQLLSVTEAGRRECHLQAEDGPLDSGRHHPGLLGTGCALPVQVESPLY